MRQYYLPTRITFGRGSFNGLREAVERHAAKKLIIVTGKNAAKKTGLTKKALELLDGYDTCLYGVESNPSINTIEEGVTLLGGEKCDAVVGLGGGSALDVAKSLAILAKNPGPLKDYLSGDKTIQKNGLPYIAVPTTSGTGSEVTMWATVWDKDEKRKYSLESERMYAADALVDPQLTLTVPPRVTAITGLDALSHAVEACWSNNSQPISDVCAMEAIRLVFGNLKKACDNPADISLRENMSKASLFAGLAFSNTKTTACHSVSYPLTARFGVDHGLACAITLPSLLEYNSQAAGEKTGRIAGATGAGTVKQGAENIRKLVSSLGLPTRLSELDIQAGDLEVIVSEGFTRGRTDNNPRKLSRDDLLRILREIF